MRFSYLKVPAVALAALLAYGCATGEGVDRRGPSDLITLEQIQELRVPNAYEVVQRLRPRWLRSRGPTSIQNPDAGEPWVYVDGVRYGRLNGLREISRESVSEMRLISAADATMRFGTGHQGGAILVATRR